MAVAFDLINITNLVLVNDFEDWFKTTNEIIDALNPLQIYDVDDTGVFVSNPAFVTEPITPCFSLGLEYIRNRRFTGDLLIEVNANPPLGFNPVDGALELSFSGPFAPPPLTGIGCAAPNIVENNDQYIVHDVSDGVGGTTKLVAAENMLPPRILCDHTFGDALGPDVTITIEGDLIVNGTQTILNTTTVEATDPTIDLNSDGTGTGTPAGNDALLGTGGIRVLSTDGNKTILWQNADQRWHINDLSGGFQIDSLISLFVRTVEPLTNNLDLLGSGTGDAVSFHFHESTVSDHWRLTLRDILSLGPQVPYVLGSLPDGLSNPLPVNDAGTFVLQHSTAVDAAPVFDLSIFFDSVTPTNDPLVTGFARNLNADLLDGCHSSPVSLPFNIPCADAAGLIDSDYIPVTGNLRKQINQTAHGLQVGQVVRLDSTGPDVYVLARANTDTNAESVGIVSLVVDADNFELTLLGCIFGLNTSVANIDSPGPNEPLKPGQAYFLDLTTPGAFTAIEPLTGNIKKTVFVATSTTDAIVVNYVGGRVDPTAGTFVATLSNDVDGSGVFVAGTLNIPVTIVERTQQILTTPVGPAIQLFVEDSTGAFFRTFEITMTASQTLELQEPSAVGWNAITTPNFHTNSVTLVITQDGTGGRVPTITISGGTIIWDNSATQPPAQLVGNKTTIYTLINVTSNPGVWYGSRAVFQI